MTLTKDYKQQWLGNVKGDLLAGLVSALAIIPEVIGFTIVAGVSPMVGLYTSFCFTILLSFFGGRPAMVSAAAGSMALVIVNLVRNYGVEYLFAATILAGLIQLVLGIFKVGNLLKFIPNTVMVGFVDALAILIFISQINTLAGEPMVSYILTIIGIGIVYLFPKITKAIPAGLVAIIVVAVIGAFVGGGYKTIGDLGSITASLPTIGIPNIPFNWETLSIIFPYSISLALVGLLETLLTAQVVDEMTKTNSNKNVECKAQGIANFISGFIGGMGGCAMIGQAIINVRSGGRGRLSTLTSGVCLILLVFTLKDIMVQIPLAAFVAVMITVSIATFDWSTLKNIKKTPLSDLLVILVTVLLVVVTDNLAIGVIVGVVLEFILFTIKMSKIFISRSEETKNKVVYTVKGTLFFASCSGIMSIPEEVESYHHVKLDLSDCHIIDQTAVTSLKKTIHKLNKSGKKVEYIGFDASL